MLEEEKLADNAEKMGKILRAEMNELPSKVVKLVRGKGLLNAIVIQPGNYGRERKNTECFKTHLQFNDRV